MPRVQNLFRAPKKRLPMEELSEVRAVGDIGLEGFRPGIIRENITTDGLNVNSLQIGQQLRIGEARLEVSEVCNPCDQMEAIRPGLRKELWGRRGMLCRVLESGVIRRGDPIEKLWTGISSAEAVTRT